MLRAVLVRRIAVLAEGDHQRVFAVGADSDPAGLPNDLVTLGAPAVQSGRNSFAAPTAGLRRKLAYWTSGACGAGARGGAEWTHVARAADTALGAAAGRRGIGAVFAARAQGACSVAGRAEGAGSEGAGWASRTNSSA